MIDDLLEFPSISLISTQKYHHIVCKDYVGNRYSPQTRGSISAICSAILRNEDSSCIAKRKIYGTMGPPAESH